MLQVGYTLVQVSHPRSFIMKKVLLLLALLFLFVLPIHSISFRIALSDFAVHSDNPRYKYMGKGISEMIAVELAKSTGVNLIEREKRAKVLEEIEFALSDLADAAKQVEVGKMLAAKYLVFGEIIDMDKEVLISLRMVDIESTMVVWNEQIVSSISNYDYITGYFTVSILEHLGLSVPPSTVAKVESLQEKNEDAVVAFSKAVDAYDRNETTEAKDELAKARKVDPDNEAVQLYLRKLIVNLSKFKLEAAAMQLPSRNPAYLGILQYAQFSSLWNMSNTGQTPYLESFDLIYQGGYGYFITGISFPVGSRLGFQTNIFGGPPERENIRDPVTEHTQVAIAPAHWGVQLSPGWAATQSMSLGMGASIFLVANYFEASAGISTPPNTWELGSAYCFGVLFKNSDSTVMLDIMSGFSLDQKYLLHAEDFRDYLDSVIPSFTIGDSVARPILLEGTLTITTQNRRVFLVLRQRNDIFIDQPSYTGRVTPGLEYWLFNWFSVRGALELSIHKMVDVVDYGVGIVGGIGFRSIERGWDFELGGSYRMEPIHSIPGAVFYDPAFYVNISKNLLSIQLIES
jgi:TolB-like protein